MTIETAKQTLYAIAREIDFLENTARILGWDMRVNLPKAAGEYRGETIGFLSGEVYRRKTSPALDEALSVLEEGPEQDEITEALIRKLRREHRHLSEVPAELESAYAAHNLKTELVWQEARQANDYALVRPYAEKEFEFLREIQAAHRHADDPLTGLMQEGEPGLTCEKVDALFGELKAFELPFLERLKESPRKLPDLPAGPFLIRPQKALIREVLTAVGFDFERGRIDESAHPITTFGDRTDVRFTDRFYEEDFTRALLTAMHEGGHALHCQGGDPSLRFTTLEDLPYAALNESQSRFMENIVGRSLPFWEWCLPIAQKHFPALAGRTPGQLWEALGRLSIGTNRLTADELTYNLHIIIRYELEKALFDRSLSFGDLPEAWNAKYREYLGVTPASDAEGVLQDMHWYSGFIGYFQSYTFGNFYDGHFLKAMRRDVPDIPGLIHRGEFAPITGWLREHVQRYGGTKEPAEILAALGEGALSARGYIDYIKAKYEALYL